MNQAPPEEERFKTNILDLTSLVHELSTICWDNGVKDVNPTLVSLAESYLSGYDKIKLINTFIEHSYKNPKNEEEDLWTKIHSRNENFFIDNAHIIFQHLPIDTNNINAFKVFFTAVDQNGNNIIIQEDRDAIWDIFGSLIKICIKYVHRERGIEMISTPNGLRPKYQNQVFPHIEVRKQARLWGIKLPLPGGKYLE
jgi:hypothetical protein